MLDRAEALAALGASDARLRGALQYLVRESDDEAIGHIVARLRADPWGPARHLLDLALLANGTRQAMEALLFASSTLQRRDPVLRGLVLADGAPGLAFEDNPWGIPAGASLDNALAVIWAPVASLSRAERAVHALQREVLALALVELDQPRRWAVGYLHPWRRMAYEIEAEDLPSPPECFARREALDWADYADLGLFFGFGPSTSGSTLSRAMGEFWRVHDGMEDGLLWLNGHDRLWPLAQIFDALKTPAGLEHFRLNNGNRSPDEFIEIFCHGDDAADVLDLGSRDASGDPMVGRWYGQGMDILDERIGFWEWLEKTIPRSFLKLLPDEDA